MKEMFMSVFAFIGSNRDLILNIGLGVLAVSVMAMLARMQRLFGLVSDWVSYHPSPGREADNASASAPESARFDETIESLRKELLEERNRINTLQKLLIETKEKNAARLELLEKSFQSSEKRLNDRLDNMLCRTGMVDAAAVMKKERIPI